ncbi:LysR family transcriptional regulator [Propionispora vibrioides]|uniref:DNA-binding transcriptional regulator, LysR family n=1 Tax=Propionispora vibrioides TaxID=112903 RepID=A0A1H8VZJ5_9FIRM|nr:LysR family transcriptional regulator [Propionispora vibrioides]SEP20819.1 DNA-binding transcriptional regulator, LysR family [Propionispora vibrioides]
MRIEQLLYLIAIYKAQSISLAAERSHISQPAMSSAISKLEDELGVRLLKRTSEGVYPTEPGLAVIQKAQDIVRLMEEITLIGKQDGLELKGDISLAVEQHVNMILMPKVLTLFKQRYPNVMVMQKVGESNNILGDIQAGKADFGIVIKTRELEKTKDLQVTELFCDQLVVLAGRNNPLAAKGSIQMSEAIRQPLILLNTEYTTQCGISEILSEYGPLQVAFRVDSIPMLEKLLQQGRSIAFVPRLAAGEYTQTQKLVALPVADASLDIPIVMARSKRHHFSTLEKELMKAIRAAFSS